jgi:hypothetical protein
MAGPQGRSSVQRLIDRRFEDDDGSGRPLSARARQTARSVEAYLKTGIRPRWMERVTDIDQGVATERRRLDRAYRELARSCAGDPETFARRWHEIARGWPFDALNELIAQHNDWYPVERQLPMDPRTRDYVPIAGRSYRRRELGPDWVLEQFPPTLTTIEQRRVAAPESG